jgi:hypothetical protein
MKIECILKTKLQKKNKLNKKERFHPSLFNLFPFWFHFQHSIFLPFEPTLFPKLQVYFADFPNPRYAIKTPEASYLEDLMRLSVRNGLKMINNTLFFMEQ